MRKVTNVLVISMIVNFILSLIKVMAGFIYSSGALIADGLHSFSDLITDVMGIIGSVFAKKPSDEKHPYGHGKLEYLISIFIGLVILFLGIMIIYNSIKRDIVLPSTIVIFVSLFTIITKFILSHYLIKKGRLFNSAILISSGKESNTDVISSIVVLISSILMQFDNSVLRYSDIIAGVLVGIFVFKVGIDVMEENISTILGEQETDLAYLDRVRSTLLENSSIKGIEELVILKYGPYYKLIAKVNISSSVLVGEAYNIINVIENKIRINFKQIDYIDINVRPYKD